jgi:hypothetical protein
MHGKTLPNWSLLTEQFIKHSTVPLLSYHILMILHHVILNHSAERLPLHFALGHVLCLPHIFQASVQLLAETGSC